MISTLPFLVSFLSATSVEAMKYKLDLWGLIVLEDTSKKMLLLKLSFSTGIILISLLLLWFRLSNNTKTLVIGLTGGICSGKSKIREQMKKLGASTIDADKLGHSAYELGSDGYNEVVTEFGNQIINSNDGTIDRKILGSIVFNDSSKMRKLEGIVWPIIGKNIKEQIEEFTKENVRYVVIEAAVLLNAGWYDMCDSIIVAATDRDIARDRLIKRNSLSPKEALRRLNAQQSNAERIASANQRDMKGGVHVVWNNGTEEELEDTVNQVCVQMKKRFK